MTKTSMALYLLYLLTTKGCFDKKTAIKYGEVSLRTFNRSIAEVRMFLSEFSINKELVYNRKTGMYQLVDIVY